MANKNLFTTVQLPSPDSNTFDLTHDHKTTLRFGDLVPIMCLEAVPGDKFKIGCESLIRFAPLLAPVMHRYDATIHYFFVPNRLLWSNWEKFIVDPQTTILPPTLDMTVSIMNNNAVNKLANYLGIPFWDTVPSANFTEKVNALPFAAYQCIYDEYYRDQNLIQSGKEYLNTTFPNSFKDKYLQDGHNSLAESTLIQLRKRAWEHDYFTSALPFAQKGSAVTIPLYGFNDIPVRDKQGAKTITATPANISVQATTGGAGFSDELVAMGSLLDGQAATINELRRAFKLQEFLERNARGGTRYIEHILAHFGVQSSDARLQRPEYICGTKQPITISEVLNSTGEDGGLPQGNMAGHGVSVLNDGGEDYYCEEHGYIMGIMSILPRTVYMQGIPRHFFKFDPLSYFWPTFENIGEQEIQYNELYAYQDDQDEIFGYIPRYSEYKYQPSRVSGSFTRSLDYWHSARRFGNRPQLNQAFVECTEADDIFAVADPNVENVYVHVLNIVHATRKMQYFGNPSF